MTISLNDFAEAFRKAMVEVLVPEIRQLREEMNEHFEKIDERFEKVDERFEKIDERFEKVDERFVRIDERFEKVFTELGELKIGQKEILARLDIAGRLSKLEERVNILSRDSTLSASIARDKNPTVK